MKIITNKNVFFVSQGIQIISHSIQHIPTPMKKLLLFGLLLRVFLAFSYDTGDTGAINQATTLFLQHKDVYDNASVFFSPPPFALHILALLHVIADGLHIPFSGFWKMPSVFADTVLIYLIYLIAVQYGKKTQQQAYSFSLWYAWNPVALFISGYHGQMESIWITLMILSWYVLKMKKHVLTASILSGLAVAYKFPAILLLPSLLVAPETRKRKWVFLGTVLLVVFLSFFPEIVTSTHGFIKQSVLYSSTPGVWGFSNIVVKLFSYLQIDRSNLSIISIGLEALLFVTLLLYFFRNRQNKSSDFFRFNLGVISIFFILTPGYGNQYLLWPLPFLILTENPFLKLYTILVTFGFLNTYGLYYRPLDNILIFLQTNVFYKTGMLYPYDLLFPVWLLYFIILFKRNRSLSA